MEEISYAKFMKLKDKYWGQACNLIKKSEVVSNDDSRWYFSYDAVPCRYENKEIKETWCPLEEKYVPALPLPEGFASNEKNEVQLLYHWAGGLACWELVPFETEVVCLCITKDNKFFRTSHLVGQCPWKE